MGRARPGQENLAVAASPRYMYVPDEYIFMAVLRLTEVFFLLS